MARILRLALLMVAGLASGCAHAQTQTQAWRPDPIASAASYGPPSPDLLPPEAGHDEIARWLADHAPSSRGKEVFVSGAQAFWFEHQDRDAKSPMHVVATIHTENFADRDSEIRSSYQVTDFDCEKQTQYRI